MVKSRKGTGFVIALGAFASVGMLASMLGNNFGSVTSPVATTKVENKAYGDEQLDAWISEARKVLRQENIPGTHASIKRNVIRESGGNPKVCNDWDINARNGVPSCGLLQVIPPTFEAHKLPQSAYDKAGVAANANDRFDPIANIVTACAYAWSRYPGKGGINGINEAY